MQLKNCVHNIKKYSHCVERKKWKVIYIQEMFFFSGFLLTNDVDGGTMLLHDTFPHGLSAKTHWWLGGKSRLFVSLL